MRVLIGITALIIAVSPYECDAAAVTNFADGNALTRIHFVGLTQVAADPNAESLKQFGAMPESRDLKEKTLDKLATAPFRWLKDRIATGSNDYSAEFRPLVADILQNEWYAEIRGAGELPPELAIAVRVNDKQAHIWQTNLAKVLGSWTGIPVRNVKLEGYSGWELQKHDVPNRIRFARAGEWVVFGWGEDETRLETGLLQRIKSRKKPGDAAKDTWLDATIDWTKPVAGSLKLSQAHLVVQGRKDFVRPQLTLRFAEPLGMSLEPWRVPTNFIHSPIVSFTAARGIAAFLKESPLIKEMNASVLPNQVFIWAMEQIPFETCLAAPMPGASNFLEQLQSKWLPQLNTNFSAHDTRLEAEWTTNNEIALKGLPLVAPFLKAVSSNGEEALLGGFFPSPPREAPLPPELLRELNSARKLVYYDWEITAGRLPQTKVLNQLRFIARMNLLPDTNAPAQKWLEAAKPRLGKSSATRITLTAPNELTVVRNSPLGLTAAELTLLGAWLDAEQFPLKPKYKKLGEYGFELPK